MKMKAADYAGTQHHIPQEQNPLGYSNFFYFGSGKHN
jgi:hypothetical protein